MEARYGSLQGASLIWAWVRKTCIANTGSDRWMQGRLEWMV